MALFVTGVMTVVALLAFVAACGAYHQGKQNEIRVRALVLPSDGTRPAADFAGAGTDHARVRRRRLWPPSSRPKASNGRHGEREPAPGVLGEWSVVFEGPLSASEEQGLKAITGGGWHTIEFMHLGVRCQGRVIAVAMANPIESTVQVTFIGRGLLARQS